MSESKKMAAIAGGALLAAVFLGTSMPVFASKEKPEFEIDCRENAAGDKKNYCKVKGLAGEDAKKLPDNEVPHLKNVEIILIADNADPGLDDQGHKHGEKEHPTVPGKGGPIKMHPGAPPYCHKYIQLNGVWYQVHC